MKSKSWPMSWNKALVASAAALAFSGAAMAGTVTMEDVTPGTILFVGDSFSQAGVTLTVTGSASSIDTPAAFGAGVGLDAAAPKGNNTQFFIGLNDATVTLKDSGGGTFRIAGFDFGFVAALTRLFNPGDVAGALVAAYETATGATGFETWSFGAADAQGEFSFITAGAGDVGALSGSLNSVAFFACTSDNAGLCVHPNNNFGQFALDNIKVPEPGSLALAVLALGIAGGVRARRVR
jgi:hypothetical protein